MDGEKKWEERAQIVGEKAMIEALDEVTKGDCFEYKMMVAFAHAMSMQDTLFIEAVPKIELFGATRKLVEWLKARGYCDMKSPSSEDLKTLFEANFGIARNFMETQDTHLDDRSAACVVAMVPLKQVKGLQQVARERLAQLLKHSC